jgi:hypothetical protein
MAAECPLPHARQVRHISEAFEVTFTNLRYHVPVALFIARQWSIKTCIDTRVR